MAKWEIKGVVDDEPKTAQETEQAVLDNAVEKGDITPEAAGQETEDVPVVNLDQDSPEVETSEETTEQEAETAAPEEPDNGPLELVTDELVEESVESQVEEEVAPAAEAPQLQLPENVDKLVKFMEETGGSIEDYINLNRNLDDINEGQLLREYYKQSKPWDSQEIEEYLEDNFSYDEELDDPKDVRSKKRAFKEELFKC